MLTVTSLLLTTAFLGSYVLADGSAPFVPARRDISLHFNTKGGYYISVIMGSQRVNLTMSTSTGVTYVAGVGCAECTGALYDPASSSTVQRLANTSTVDYLGSSTMSLIAKENCSLTVDDGSLWNYPNQTIAILYAAPKSILNAASGADIGQAGIAGLIGLGTNRGLESSNNGEIYDPSFDDSIYGQFFALHPTAQNFSFGIRLEPSGDSKATQVGDPGSDSSAGILNWLQPDDTPYDSTTLTWAQINNSLPVHSMTDPRDWLFTLDAWRFILGSNTVTSKAPMPATVDPLYQGIYIPSSQARLIHAAIPGSMSRPQYSTLGSLAQSWYIPCDADFSFDVQIGAQSYRMDQNSLVINNGDGTCASGIEAWIDDSVDHYMLGARFMSTVYMVFNVQHNGSSIGFANRTINPASRHLNLKAIIGGAAGGGVLLILLMIASCCYASYRLRKHVEDDTPPTTAQIETYSIVPFSSLAHRTDDSFSVIRSYPVPTHAASSSFLNLPPTTRSSGAANLAYNMPSSSATDHHYNLPPVTRPGDAVMHPYKIAMQAEKQSIASVRPPVQPFLDSDVPDSPSYFRVISRNGRESPQPNNSQPSSSFSSPYMSGTLTSSGSNTSLIRASAASPVQSLRALPPVGPASAATTFSRLNEGKGKERESVGPPAYSPRGFRLANAGSNDFSNAPWLPGKKTTARR